MHGARSTPKLPVKPTDFSDAVTRPVPEQISMMRQSPIVAPLQPPAERRGQFVKISFVWGVAPQGVHCRAHSNESFPVFSDFSTVDFGKGIRWKPTPHEVRASKISVSISKVFSVVRRTFTSVWIM